MLSLFSLNNCQSLLYRSGSSQPKSLLRKLYRTPYSTSADHDSLWGLTSRFSRILGYLNAPISVG
jgi:hypothetical protein